jgi:hypothetical protein
MTNEKETFVFADITHRGLNHCYSSRIIFEAKVNILQ